MKSMPLPYENFPGDHSGSLAMRGLLHHDSGRVLPEEVIFALGAGAADHWTATSTALFEASQLGSARNAVAGDRAG